MILHCLIVDDEPLAQKLMARFVADTANLELVAICSDTKEAAQHLEHEQVDLIFLDVKMPGKSGVDWLRSLDQPPLVILVTAYPEFAVEGFELQVADYLLKPFSYDRFLKAVQKASYLLAVERTMAPHNRTQTHLLVKADRKLFQVPLEEILYFQAYGDYVKIHRTRSKPLLAKERLGTFEHQVDSALFIRIHRSYIVSIGAIQFIEGNQVSINGELLPISLSHKENLLKRLEERS
ncbi:MAG: LytTR family DNA-binding domain-containing protein [Saprospiraceae bacterium]|nr:LytTR family DNA-binding domain-containing protein [Saprospiraceae bacterium]